ncbi:hypothetical protein MGG_17335 [Pyricularia oryzae 70-15]|uniref:Secreted protein n=1 Tax=Pyricularia oryzae (strain 70-15 / ATCC MYA-4617 / FGSC 8958) TaxID=242507 RepID=G4NDD0_PYRO7|nr:uncharacterized protein MGG_17335 [Pyricularia oryzae 70-15]EHA48419.1 hypothetical protein MGG_17335 [Pyricularia oryzae 70-15]
MLPCLPLRLLVLMLLVKVHATRAVKVLLHGRRLLLKYRRHAAAAAPPPHRKLQLGLDPSVHSDHAHRHQRCLARRRRGCRNRDGAAVGAGVADQARPAHDAVGAAVVVFVVHARLEAPLLIRGASLFVIICLDPVAQIKGLSSPSRLPGSQNLRSGFR